MRVELRAVGGGAPPSGSHENRPKDDGTFTARLPAGVYAVTAPGPAVRVQPKWAPRPWMTTGVRVEEGAETSVQFRRTN